MRMSISPQWVGFHFSTGGSLRANACSRCRLARPMEKPEISVMIPPHADVRNGSPPLVARPRGGCNIDKPRAQPQTWAASVTETHRMSNALTISNEELKGDAVARAEKAAATFAKAREAIGRVIF